MAGELFFSILAAYAFARMEFPGRNLIFGILISTIMIPGMVTIIPNFLTVTWFGRIMPVQWINNWPALTIPFMGSVFSIFLLRQFFAQIPDELYDATLIDGGGHFQFLWNIALPLSKAPLAAFALFFAVGYWNTYFSAVLYLNDAEKWPLQVMLRQVVMLSQIASFLDAGMVEELRLMKVIPPETVKMATVTIVIAPILMVYPFLQKYFAKGVLVGGVKG